MFPKWNNTNKTITVYITMSCKSKKSQKNVLSWIISTQNMTSHLCSCHKVFVFFFWSLKFRDKIRMEKIELVIAQKVTQPLPKVFVGLRYGVWNWNEWSVATFTKVECIDDTIYQWQLKCWIFDFIWICYHRIE